MKFGGSTPPFRGPDGATVARSIADISTLRLGDLDQWVMIRGEDVANPPLILLHGGPGFPETRLFRHFNAALEKSFTVVYWEQRGAGKSFDRRMPPSAMTVGRFIADLDELVDAVLQRLGKKKVVILGHSWGSALGTLYAARFPQKVAAYVGTGQIGDLQASEKSSYEFVRVLAKRRRNRKAIRQLHDIGPPPHTAKTLQVQRKWLMRFVGIARGMSVWKVIRIVLSGSEASLFDLPNIVRGARLSLNALWAEVSGLNLVKTVPALPMPVFFFLGRYDHQVAAETSAAYFDVLKAPFKQLVWFDQSAHMPPFEEPEKFNAQMVELVRPAVA